MLQSIERYFKGRAVYEVDIPNHNIIDRKTFDALIVAIGLILRVVVILDRTLLVQSRDEAGVDAEAVAHMQHQLLSQLPYQVDSEQ